MGVRPRRRFHGFVADVHSFIIAHGSTLLFIASLAQYFRVPAAN
jgi:hypothetical protein